MSVHSDDKREPPASRKPLPLKELADFRATMPRLRRPAAELLREVRDEVY
ncbi:MAG: hypothetical protein OXF89_01325 [Rhodospirillaceae bacterium]|nr:hypothetical protein [Rhodospirillaceae bacterium]MCY4065808.1 hypothetical protein [Rhodospirillaceae bacterium]